MISAEVFVAFLISLLVTSVIIYLATKLLGEREGFGTAMLAALAGSIIFSAVSYFVGTGWFAALIGGVAWLAAIRSLYRVGWIKSFIIAAGIWLVATIVSWVVPNLPDLW